MQLARLELVLVMIQAGSNIYTKNADGLDAYHLSKQEYEREADPEVATKRKTIIKMLNNHQNFVVVDSNNKDRFVVHVLETPIGDPPKYLHL